MDSRRFVIVLVFALGLSGCVSKDTYNAQVLRTNNFQRLLSEEEKRSVEFSADIIRLKEQVASLETKNKTLTAQLNEAKAQVVRSLEEVGRLQDEVKRGRAFGGGSGFLSAPEPAAAPEPAFRGPSQEPPDRLGELQESDPVLRDVEKKFEKKKGKPAVQAKAPKPSKAPLPPLEPEEAPPALAPVQAPPPPPAKVRAKKPNEVPSPPPLPAADVVPPAPVQPPPLPSPPAAPARMQKSSKVSPPEPEVVLPAPVQASPPPAKLQARTSAPPPAQPAPPPSDSFFRYHQVQKGETLDAIAKRYRTDAQTLRELNDLAANESVRPGDRIIVGQK